MKKDAFVKLSLFKYSNKIMNKYINDIINTCRMRERNYRINERQTSYKLLRTRKIKQAYCFTLIHGFGV